MGFTHIKGFLFIGEEEIILDNDKGKDSRLLGWIGDSEGQTWKVCLDFNIRLYNLLCLSFRQSVRNAMGEM